MTSDNELFWRNTVTSACGGKTFDAPGTGYSFSAVLAEERELEKDNIPGDASSALLKLSVADPTWKMPRGAFQAGIEYYSDSDDATRYTDNSGIRTWRIQDIHETIAEYLKSRYGKIADGFSQD